MYEQTWLALKANKEIKLRLLDSGAKARIIRGISKEKNADANKAMVEKIFHEEVTEVNSSTLSRDTFLILRLREVIKTRYTVPL